MRNPLLLLAALVAPIFFILPAYVIANGCVHHQIRYQVPIPTQQANKPQTPPLEAQSTWDRIFFENAVAYKNWAAAMGGRCGGKCSDVSKINLGSGIQTYEMVCSAARLSKKAVGVPATVGGLRHTVAGGERRCDVNCSPGSGQTCAFTFGKC